MKTLLAAFLMICSVAYSQQVYKDLPVIKASKNAADYRINNEWIKGRWGINADLNPDVLQIPTRSKTIDFAFYTDMDSIRFDVKGNSVKRFYVLTADGRYALTEVQGYDYKPLAFDGPRTASMHNIRYESDKENPYLKSFRDQYPFDELVKGLKADSAKALRIVNWVHKQWNHNGSNEPKKKDAISILQEVKEGKNFRCVEYGIVSAAALNAIGMPARVLALKTKDVETTTSGAGHVLLEVYLKDLNKWVLLDGQYDVMPVLDGVPLNAVEFQNAIATNYDKLEIRSMSATNKGEYVNWIYPYLYYFDVSFDNREGISIAREKVGGKSNLMLVPKDAKNPTVFQVKYPISNMVYTNSLADFYGRPAGHAN